MPSNTSEVNKSFIQWLLTILGPTFVVPFIVPLVMLIALRRIRTGKPVGGKVVVITGASSGLGEALAQVFYLAGCKVILASRRLDELERVKSDLLKLEPEIVTFEPVTVALDLSDSAGLEDKAKFIEDIYGRVDILVNNGGVSYRGDAITTSVEVHKRVMEVNYFGHVTLTSAFLPGMIKRKEGHIVTISSVQGRIAIPKRSAYAASKHALQAYMDSLRAEIAQSNVKVTVIDPGYVKTNLSLNAVTASGDKYGVNDESTQGGYDPIDVAKKVLRSVRVNEKERVIATIPPRLAIYIRTLLPSVYFYLMERRASAPN